jgi:hypothetical protein
MLLPSQKFASPQSFSILYDATKWYEIYTEFANSFSARWNVKIKENGIHRISVSLTFFAKSKQNALRSGRGGRSPGAASHLPKNFPIF